MYKKLITFDCGLSYVGAAIFEYSDKKLLDCYYIDTSIDNRDSAEQTADLIHKVLDVFKDNLEEALIVVEYPEQYSHSPAPRAPVQGLACTGGGIVCMLKRSTNKVKFLLPKEWKGQVPKDIMLDRIVNKLNDTEKSVLESKKLIKSKKHNVIDAIGLGLYILDRLRGV
jgi:hypothetical protein